MTAGEPRDGEPRDGKTRGGEPRDGEPRDGEPGGPAVAAVDWGGTWLRAAVAVDGELVRQARHRRPAVRIEEQCDFLCELVARLAGESGRPLSALGVGIAGVTRGGWVESASNIGIHRPYDLATRLRQGTGVPVVVVNDTQAAAVAEAASLGPGTTALITVGTGIGGAIVADGRLVLGEGAAGDFGHMVVMPDGPRCACGGRGCLEQVVSGRILDEIARDLASSGASEWLATLAARRAAERDAVHSGEPAAGDLAAGAVVVHAGELAGGAVVVHAGEPAGGAVVVHAGDLDAAALAGDPAALAALDRAATTLTSALRSITAAIDPRVIILGGGLMTGGLLLPRLVRERWLDERPPWSPAELRPALQGPDAGLRGAALLAAGVPHG